MWPLASTGCPAPSRPRAWPRCCAWWGSMAARTALPLNSRAGSSSARRWRARWLRAPRGGCLCAGESFPSADVDLRERLGHEGRGILKAAGTTALLVTHDQFEAFALGDVIGVMHEGQLHQ